MGTKSNIIIVTNKKKDIPTNENGIKSYRGYTWETDRDLSLLLSKNPSLCKYWMGLKDNRSEKDFINHNLGIVASMFKGYKKCNPNATYENFMEEVMSFKKGDDIKWS